MTTSDEMGTFCHDHYEHPLLWCEDKRRLLERKNAEESLRMWRRRKVEEMARKEKDKEEYYELFVKHCPWGRPGGGAPNVDVRRKDITAVGLHSTPTISTIHRINSFQPCRYSDYFSQHKKCHDPTASHHYHHHHHVPRLTTTHAHTMHHLAAVGSRPGNARSTVTICERDVPVPVAVRASGNGLSTGGGAKNGEALQITLKDHPSMSFRNKGHVDIELRYKPTAPSRGKPILEKIVVTESEKCPLVTEVVPVQRDTCKSPRKKKIAIKGEKPSNKEPWGKAGPGGKPWRSPKAVGNTFMKSMGWTNKEMLKDLDQDNPVTPAEKQTFKKTRVNKKLQRCCEMCVCTCPAMVPSPLKQLEKCTLALPPQHYPSHSQNSSKTNAIKKKVCPRLTRRCALGKTDAVSGAGNHKPQMTTTTDNSDNINATTTTAALGEGGGVELVPLLARRRGLNRPISLSSTDVTKRTVSNDRLSTAAMELHYLHDLNAQISQKRRSISIARQLEQDLCNKHFETFDTFWGRPGHGAPSEIKTKLKLDNLLYGVQGCVSE